MLSEYKERHAFVEKTKLKLLDLTLPSLSPAQWSAFVVPSYLSNFKVMKLEEINPSTCSGHLWFRDVAPM